MSEDHDHPINHSSEMQQRVKTLTVMALALIGRVLTADDEVSTAFANSHFNLPIEGKEISEEPCAFGNMAATIMQHTAEKAGAMELIERAGREEMTTALSTFFTVGFLTGKLYQQMETQLYYEHGDFDPNSGKLDVTTDL